MSVNDLACAIVLPFLDEEDRLVATCESLGFSASHGPAGRTILFLVDNGSTDNSPDLALKLRRDSPSGAVRYVLEPERGHAPARAAGNRAVEQWVLEMGIDAGDILVLQADADTRYLDGYVDAMRESAAGGPVNALFEATVAYPPAFMDEHRRYFDACETREAAVRHLFAPIENDCLVDDKVAGYYLSSYRHWGGFRREYDTEGDEFLSETTRLYIAGRCRNAYHVRVDEARAEHSPRRLVAEPHMHTATAGYPRSASWRRRWAVLHGTAYRLEEFTSPGWAAAWAARRRHLLSLLSVLPIHVCRSAGIQGDLSSELVRLVLDSVAPVPRDELFAAPSKALADAFSFVETLEGGRVEALLGEG